MSRIATKIRQIKESQPNVLVLDAGDFSEGSIFYTYNAGESTHRIMEALNYDAIVLGNHDWLIGPKELYSSFENTRFSIPILSANLDFSKLDPKTELKKYIKPYIIKEFQGLKVGILGLSTFQFVFDPYFMPVKLVDPLKVAQSYVDQLKDVERCDVVIILSHLGFTADKVIAEKIKKIDLIVGGHSHVLLKTPAKVNEVPITHVGKWGHYLGQMDLSYSLGKTSVVKYQVHQIGPELPVDGGVESIVSGAIQKLESKMGPIFHDEVFRSEVDIPVKDYKNENVLGHWAADALREYTKGDVAFENPSYSSRDIFKGITTTADMFNIFPNGYSPRTNKGWTVKTFNISGLYAKLLMTGVYRAGIYLKMSNAKVVLDLSKTINQVHAFSIGDKQVDNHKIYKVAGTNGIVEAIEFLKTYGIDIGMSQTTDTGVEAWRVIGDYLKAKSPITADKIKWEGRVRTLQPDLLIRPEEMEVIYPTSAQPALLFTVRNAGYKIAKGGKLVAYRASLPGDTVSPRKINLDAFGTGETVISELNPGEEKRYTVALDTTGITTGRYAATFIIVPAEGELETENNILDTYVDLVGTP